MTGEIPTTAGHESAPDFNARLHGQLSHLLNQASYEGDAHVVEMKVGESHIRITDQLFGEHVKAPRFRDRATFQEAQKTALGNASAIISIQATDPAGYEGMSSCVIFRPCDANSNSIALGTILKVAGIHDPQTRTDFIVWSKQGIVADPWNYQLIRDISANSPPTDAES